LINPKSLEIYLYETQIQNGIKSINFVEYDKDETENRHEQIYYHCELKGKRKTFEDSYFIEIFEDFAAFCILDGNSFIK
jgi:hypothetical protein